MPEEKRIPPESETPEEAHYKIMLELIGRTMCAEAAIVQVNGAGRFEIGTPDSQGKLSSNKRLLGMDTYDHSPYGGHALAMWLPAYPNELSGNTDGKLNDAMLNHLKSFFKKLTGDDVTVTQIHSRLEPNLIIINPEKVRHNIGLTASLKTLNAAFTKEFNTPELHPEIEAKKAWTNKMSRTTADDALYDTLRYMRGKVAAAEVKLENDRGVATLQVPQDIVKDKVPKTIPSGKEFLERLPKFTAGSHAAYFWLDRSFFDPTLPIPLAYNTTQRQDMCDRVALFAKKLPMLEPRLKAGEYDVRLVFPKESFRKHVAALSEDDRAQAPAAALVISSKKANDHVISGLGDKLVKLAAQMGQKEIRAEEEESKPRNGGKGR